MKRNNKNKKTIKNSFQISKAGDIITKRLTLPSLVLTTTGGAGTNIPVTTFSSALVQSSPATEWASFAARYQEYRVKALKVIGKAIAPIQDVNYSHSTLYMGDFSIGAGPATFSQVLSDENVKLVGTHQDFVNLVTWKKNPNAKLWTSTANAIPALSQFAACFASTSTPPLSAITVYYSVTLEWLVEFRGSQ
jgi:hypothetical protein